MKSKEELANEWESKHKGWYDLTTSSFIAGYEKCEELLKKYIEFIDYEDGSTFLSRKNILLTDEERQYLKELYEK